jgi:hypothetical protein
MALAIILVVWVAVIPALVLSLATVVARRRRACSTAFGHRPRAGMSLRLVPEIGDSERPRYEDAQAGYGAVRRANSSGSGRRPAAGPRLRLERTR